jgi:hypothetical protein
MTVITHNRRRSRLSTLIDQPGGISIGVALTQAQDNLSNLSTRSRDIIEAQVQALIDMAAPTTVEETPRALDVAYGHSSAIIDAACPFEMPDLCAAASNLCDLVDTAAQDQIFDWRVVTVHAQSMRLLLALGPEAADAKAKVLESLKAVLKAKSGQSDDTTSDDADLTDPS